MTVITTTLHVGPDGAISIPEKLPAGDYTATIIPARTAAHSEPSTMEDFTVHDEPWDDSISLRRKDLYDNEGRLR